MYNVRLMNKIAKVGTDNFDPTKYTVGEEINNPSAILVRSADLHEFVFPDSVKAVARAGAGVNNIPLDKCADNGIVVFNTPGANANGVKEIVLCALFLASRDIVGGFEWSKTLKGDEDAAKKVEKGKSQFAGCEILGKTLGIIGLGAIGRLVANAADALGMNVVGYDPYLSDAAKALLAPNVKIVASYDDIYNCADYITLHIPATAETKGMLNASAFSKMKDGVKILNFSRADLVNSTDILVSLENGKIAKYIVDFPTTEIIDKNKNIITIPHLGASTAESEDNCAIMAVKQIIDYFENGNLVNAVTYPRLVLERKGSKRICVLFKNTDADKISAVIGNCIQSANAVKGVYGYAVYDVDGDVNINAIKAVNGVTGVNVID